jgi:hypothetical protein
MANGPGAAGNDEGGEDDQAILGLLIRVHAKK